MLDARGEIQEANPAAVALLGEPLLRQTFAAVLARAAVNSGAIGEHTELRTGRFVNVSRRDLRHGGEVVLLTDVTESHLMNVFLARQQRLVTMGELAAGLAHQIRTPLAAALLYATQMSIPGRSAEDLTRCSEKTVGSLKQLDKLVNDMLAFAHGGATRELVSVSALLEQVAQWLRPALAPGRAPDHPHRGAGTHGASQCTVAGLGGAESRHQRAAIRRRGARPGVARAPRGGRPRADRRERQRSRRTRRPSGSGYSSRSSPRARAATASACPSSRAWSRRTPEASGSPVRPRRDSAGRGAHIHHRFTRRGNRMNTLKESVLIVEDDADLREALIDTLRAAGLAAVAAADADQALRLLEIGGGRAGDLRRADAGPERLRAAVLHQAAAARICRWC